MGWGTIWADYYDAEYYEQKAAGLINISNDYIENTTWCSLTGENLSWSIENCMVENQ